MAVLAHVFLHVGLCSAVARASPQMTVAMRVRMSYSTGAAEFDKTFSFARGDDPQAVVEFDIPRGTYRLQLDAPKYGCSTSDYLDILEEHNRNINETLGEGAALTQAQVPGVLMDGSAPISFLYAKPTFVLFEKGLACNQPISPALPVHVNIEYDQGSYYVWLYSDASLEPHSPVVVALRLKTTTGLAHYIRVPIAVPLQRPRWPDRVRMDVTSDMLDGLATEKTETLLCPKLWQTSAH